MDKTEITAKCGRVVIDFRKKEVSYRTHYPPVGRFPSLGIPFSDITDIELQPKGLFQGMTFTLIIQGKRLLSKYIKDGDMLHVSNIKTDEKEVKRVLEQLASACGLTSFQKYGRKEVPVCDAAEYTDAAEAAQEKREELQLQKKKDQLNDQVKAGKWPFPVKAFYLMCCDNQITSLDTEYAFQKAVVYAKRAIREANHNIDIGNCGYYLEKERLVKYLEEGKRLLSGKTIAQKEISIQVISGAPSEQEKTYIRKAQELYALSGTEKYQKMLTELLNEYNAKITALREGEEAMKLLGMIYMDQQKKETSWAVMGGIAEGIAGPAAGIAVAMNTIENNNKIREHNENMRRVSMDILSGIPNMSDDRYQLEEEREEISNKISEWDDKVVLSMPDGKEIWDNIATATITVKKTESGILSVSLPVYLKKPFELDVPNHVQMVVDGVLRGEVWFNDIFISDIYFPLPVYGIASNNTELVTLDGLCSQIVNVEGTYTVKMCDRQKLWIMEA